MIDENYKPESVESAAKTLAENWHEFDNPDNFLPNDPQLHFGWGRRLRNEWGMWDQKSDIYKDAYTTYNITHGDDIYGLVTEWATHLIGKEEFNPQKQAQVYIEHWNR